MCIRDRVGLGDLENRRVDRLSGGQRQRAWIAMVLAQETSVLLLDEPTTYLDPALQADMLRLVRRLNAELGITVVSVLHDITLAANFADRVIGMRSGRLLFEDEAGSSGWQSRMADVFDVEVPSFQHPELISSAIVAKL